jgi:hypothetical protein
MLYAIIATDWPDSSAQRAETRTRHLEYIRPLIEAGRIVIAGPHPALDTEETTPAGMTGSLIIGEFESLSDARHWASHDPYVLEGVFAHIDVKPLIQVVP